MTLRTITQQFAFVTDAEQYIREAAREQRVLRARAEQVLHERAWRQEEQQPPLPWLTQKTRQPTRFAKKDAGYDVGLQQVPTMTLERQIEKLLAPTTEQKAASAKATARYADVAAAEAASHSVAARSAETRGLAEQPSMAPAASDLESALASYQDGAFPRDARGVYFAARDIFQQLGTLADRWPRRARRTESGAWMRSGVVTETLDAACAAYERRWARADRDERAARDRLEELTEGNVGGEIDGVAIARAEEDVLERQEQAEFYLQVFHAARATYTLMVGAGWQTTQRIKTDRAHLLGLAGATLQTVHIYTPLDPRATQRVVIAGGGTEDPALVERLQQVLTKYPALTLYSTDYDLGVPAQVNRFAVANGVQLVRFQLKAEDGKAGPFRRNERMLQAAQPHAVILAGAREHGPTQALADLAAKLPRCFVWDLRAAAAAETEKTPPVTA